MAYRYSLTRNILKYLFEHVKGGRLSLCLSSGSATDVLYWTHCSAKTNVVEIKHERLGFAEQYSVVAVRQSTYEPRWTGHARYHGARAAVDVIALDIGDVTAVDVASANDVDITPMRNGRGRLDARRQVPAETTGRTEHRRTKIKYLRPCYKKTSHSHRQKPVQGKC